MPLTDEQVREGFGTWNRKGCDEGAESFAGTDLPESVSFAMLGFYGGSHFGYSKAKEEVDELKLEIQKLKLEWRIDSLRQAAAYEHEAGNECRAEALCKKADALIDEVIAIDANREAALSALGEAGEKES